MKIPVTLSAILFASSFLARAESLEISTQSDWERVIDSSKGIVIKDGLASPPENRVVSKPRSRNSIQSVPLIP